MKRLRYTQFEEDATITIYQPLKWPEEQNVLWEYGDERGGIIHCALQEV